MLAFNHVGELIFELVCEFACDFAGEFACELVTQPPTYSINDRRYFTICFRPHRLKQLLF